MHADLDRLCITVYCTADDLLPDPSPNARRKLTDAEVVTLSVAQVLMGIPSDRRFLKAARRQLAHLFPILPSQDALHKRPAARDDRVLDRRLCCSESRPPRQCPVARAGGRVRPLRRDRTPLRAGRLLRLRLLAQPLALVLGHAPAPALRPRWHPARGVALPLLARALRGAETIVRLSAIS
jgi:hypothetical protein